MAETKTTEAPEAPNTQTPDSTPAASETEAQNAAESTPTEAKTATADANTQPAAPDPEPESPPGPDIAPMRQPPPNSVKGIKTHAAFMQGQAHHDSFLTFLEDLGDGPELETAKAKIRGALEHVRKFLGI